MSNMTPTTNILDIFPDGVITKLSFTVPAILTVTLCRPNVDEPFVIESCDVQTSDEKLLTEAVEAVRDLMLEHDIDIVIPIAQVVSLKTGDGGSTEHETH